MRRVLGIWIMVLFMCVGAWCTTVTSTTKIIGIDGQPFNGTLTLQLPFAGVNSQTNQLILSTPYTIAIFNGSFTPFVVPGNDIMSPAMPYTALYTDSFGNPVTRQLYYISSATFDVGSAPATPNFLNSTVTFANILSITGNATIGGILSVTGAATFKTSPWYDITAYGAKCDGATDDTVAIQAALTAANTAHGGMVFVPMGTNACVVAGQLVMDAFIDVNLIGASQSSPAGATPRSWLRFTGTTSPLISCKSCFGDTISSLYLQYTGAFAGTFIEFGHGVSGLDSSGNRVVNNFIGKTLAGGTAAVLLSLDQVIDTIVENNQFNDAAVAIRGRNAPSGAGTDYSVNNTIRANSFGISSACTITTAFLQNIGESSTIEGNDIELGTTCSAVPLAYTGAMAAGGIWNSNFIGDMTGTPTVTLFTIPTNSGWSFSGNVIGTVTANVTGFSLQNNASLSYTGNKLASGTTIGTMFSVGTGDSLACGGNKWQGSVSTFLTGTPASGACEDNTSHVRLPVGSVTVPGISFFQNNAVGWTIGTSNHMQLGYNGAGPMMSNLQLGIGSAMALISTPSTDPEANGADVSLSRGAIGIWYVGTGAAGNKAGLIQSGNTVRVASDFTTANNTSLQTITGLSWTFPAVASNYSFHCSILYSQATAAVADQFGIQAATNNPTNIQASGTVYTSTTASTAGNIATLVTTTATPFVTFTPSATATNFVANLEGTLELGASANTINIMAQTSNGADAVTVKRGSYCQLF